MFNIFKKNKVTGEIYGYDFDGVISIGITPRSENDVIITGRCIDEQDEIKAILKERGIKCKVYFNPMTLAERGNHTVEARTFSGKHKALTINNLLNEGINIVRFFEDDPIQYQIIQENHPHLQLVNIVSSLVKK
jgi:hypothetical protein